MASGTLPRVRRLSRLRLGSREGAARRRLSLLASDPARLAHLRAELRKELERSPLLDISGFAAAMGNTYRQAWRAACARHAPSQTEPENAVA